MPDPTNKPRLCIWPLLLYVALCLPFYVPLVSYIRAFPHREMRYYPVNSSPTGTLTTFMLFLNGPLLLILFLNLFVGVSFADYLVGKLYLRGTASTVTDWQERASHIAPAFRYRLVKSDKAADEDTWEDLDSRPLEWLETLFWHTPLYWIIFFSRSLVCSYIAVAILKFIESEWYGWLVGHASSVIVAFASVLHDALRNTYR